MKNFLKLLFASAVFMIAYSSCKKLDAPPVSGNGTQVTLTSSSTSLTPTVADSNNVVVSFSWTDPKYATDTSNYKYVLEIDSAQRNFSKEATKIVLGSHSTSLTGRELNAIVIGYGFTLGAPYDLEVRVSSSYGNNNEKYVSNVIRLTVTPFNDPSVLTATASSVSLSLPNAALNAVTFNWTTSFTGYSGSITYTLQYDSAGRNFTAPNELVEGVSVLADTLTQSELNETAFLSGIPRGNLGTVEYRVKAVTALGAVSYSNLVTISIQSYIPILRFYIPGSYQTSTGNGTDWTPGDAPEMIRDQRPAVLNDMYYIYIYLPAGAQFKITQGRSWDINFGDGGSGTLSTTGGNLSVATAGYYRITINRTTLNYDIREGRMGFVGAAFPVDWMPQNVFPDYALANAGTNLFIGVTQFNNGGWKLIDNDSWNSGSNAVDESRSYGTPLPSGSTLQVNGDPFADITSAGLKRVIWDGRDRDNVIYLLMDAPIMKLVGDGINSPGVNDWDPASSPLMTYTGNGVWTITIGLKANKDLKFLAGADWGALDYEDNSSQSQATGVPKGIKWEGGDNFKTPTVAGTYTITLNENTQTMRID